MVRIRMKRLGRRRRPFYRINAVDSRVKRDGRVIEQLGWYDPMGAEGKQLNLDPERIKYWLSVGAQPSDTVMDFLAKNGIVDAAAWKAKLDERVARKAAAAAAAAAAPAPAPAKKK